jgi:hypothetical protein
MAFNTTSFMAGVGAVVAVLSTGVAGGYLLTNPSHIDSPNRLQRVAASNQEANPAPVAAAAKPEIVADAAPTAAPAPATEQAAQPVPQTAAVPAVQPVVAPVEAKAPEPAHTATNQETAAPAPMAKPDTDAKPIEKANIDKARTAEAHAVEARAIEKKRTGTRKVAEQQRKQRELEVATIAVRRIIHGRDASDVVVDSDQPEQPAAEMPHFNLFGQ